jgi:hypothetical protein
MKLEKGRRGQPTLTVNLKRMALNLIIRWMKFLSHQYLRTQILLIVKWTKMTLILISVLLLNWVFQVRLPFSLCSSNNLICCIFAENKNPSRLPALCLNINIDETQTVDPAKEPFEENVPFQKLEQVNWPLELTDTDKLSSEIPELTDSELSDNEYEDDSDTDESEQSLKKPTLVYENGLPELPTLCPKIN